MLYAILGVLVIIADQAVKYLSLDALGGKDAIVSLIPNVISLVYVENRGAAFSLLAGSNARIFFIILTGVFTLAVIIALATNFIAGKFGRWCMVMVTAGGLSNCIDRVIYGYVQDMFKVELFNFAVFNLADVFITVFCFLFILYILFGGEKNAETDEPDEFDMDDDEDEEEKQPLFKKRSREERSEERGSKKKAKRNFDDYDDEPPRPVRRPAESASRQGEPVRRPISETSARSPAQPQRAARPQSNTAGTPNVRPAPVVGGDNPFAEWEKANARANARNSGYAEETMGVKINPAPSPTPVRTPAAAPAQRSAPRTPVQPSAPGTPARPVAPARKPSSDEFSLDDILNEYK